jgi:hypothetical protein
MDFSKMDKNKCPILLFGFSIGGIFYTFFHLFPPFGKRWSQNSWKNPRKIQEKSKKNPRKILPEVLLHFSQKWIS